MSVTVEWTESGFVEREDGIACDGEIFLRAMTPRQYLESARGKTGSILTFRYT